MATQHAEESKSTIALHRRGSAHFQQRIIWKAWWKLAEETWGTTQHEQGAGGAGRFGIVLSHRGDCCLPPNNFQTVLPLLCACKKKRIVESFETQKEARSSPKLILNMRAPHLYQMRDLLGVAQADAASEQQHAFHATWCRVTWAGAWAYCMFSLKAATLRRFTYMRKVWRDVDATRRVNWHVLRKIDDRKLAAASDKVAQQLQHGE
jgi:hypothetical protein